jgi:hypothetical protein
MWMGLANTQMAAHNLASLDQAVREMLEYGSAELDPTEVFGVIRKACTHGPACTKCPPPGSKVEGVRRSILLNLDVQNYSVVPA